MLTDPQWNQSSVVSNDPDRAYDIHIPQGICVQMKNL